VKEDLLSTSGASIVQVDTGDDLTTSAWPAVGRISPGESLEIILYLAGALQMSIEKAVLFRICCADLDFGTSGSVVPIRGAFRSGTADLFFQLDVPADLRNQSQEDGSAAVLDPSADHP
jgi:hypothetical protein